MLSSYPSIRLNLLRRDLWRCRHSQMKPSFLSLITLLTITVGCMTTKTSTAPYIGWTVDAMLPLPKGDDKQPGLAGAWAGVNNDALIVAGGANFPDAMPWLGGKKRYQANVYVFVKDGKGNLKAVDKMFRLP